MPIKDMKLTKSEQKEQVQPTALTDAPRYPYGLSLSLDDDTLDKLEMEKLPEVGQEMAVIGLAKVESVSFHDSGDGKKRRSVSLQITSLGVENASKEKVKSAARKLYGDEG